MALALVLVLVLVLKGGSTDLQTVVMEANDLGGKSSIRSQLGEYQL